MPRVDQAIKKPELELNSVDFVQHREPWSRVRYLLVYLALGLLLGIAFNSANTAYSAILSWLFCLLLAVATRVLPFGGLEFFVLGIGIQSTVYYWLPAIIAHYGEFNILVAYVLWIAFLILSALPTAVAGYLYSQFDKRGRVSRSLSLGLAWTTAEVFVPSLIPWKLAHTQLPFTWFSIGSDLLGVSLLSGLMLYWSSTIITLLQKNSVALLAPAITMILYFSYGFYRSAALSTEISSTRPLSLGIIQPNLSPKKDFSPEVIDVVLERQRRLSGSILNGPQLDLLVWPESSVWIDYPDEVRRVIKGSPADPFPGLTVPLIFGGQSSLKATNENLPLVRNSVFLMTPDGRFAGRYFKQVLFPFSEKIPLQETFPFLKRLNRKKFEVAAGNAAQATLKFRRANEGEVISVGTVICYEDLWSEPLRRQVAEGGAQVLFSFSNDAWFLQSPAAQEHHLVAAWRSVELRRYLLRATMDGVTAVLDPFGREVEKLPSFTEAALRSTEVRPLNSRSLFSRVGDLPIRLLCAVFSLAFALPLRGRSKTY